MRDQAIASGRRLSRAARTILLVAAALLAALVFAPAASASFHLIKVREVYPGSLSAPGAEFVELQMFAAGQNFVGGQSIKLYAADGSVTKTYTMPSSVANGANQRTVLLATPDASLDLGVSPDFDIGAGDSLSPAGGAACYPGAVPPDCVTWGSFTPQSGFPNPPSPSGANAPAITDGMSLTRSISPGCPTLLEAGDDTDNTSVDFALTAPSPRNNATTPTETACLPPDTVIDTKPDDPTAQTSASFTYHETPTDPGATFQCKLDSAIFASCPDGGPQMYSSLAPGSHTFQVRASGAGGTDPSPATFTWFVGPSDSSIVTEPSSLTNSDSASFTYSANPNFPGQTTFECKLDSEVDFTTCPNGGMSYSTLPEGSRTFSVRALTPGGTDSSPASFSWTIDRTRPETDIETQPPDPSASSSASFTYASNEPNSTFECSLDGAAFSPCSPAGQGYTNLSNGPHIFQVRATDQALNTDATLAAYTWNVAVPVPMLNPPQALPTPPTPKRKKRCKRKTRSGASPSAKARKCDRPKR